MTARLPAELGWVGAVFAAGLGLILGSFVNVLIYRLPRGKSVIFPSSACPGCGKPIAPYDNIPVLSYLLLGGRCRRCKASISPRYPLVESLVGGASLWIYLRHGFGLEYVVELAFVSAMVSLVFIDYDHHLLPNAITYPGIVAGLLLAGPRDGITVIDALLGAVVGAGLLLAVAELYLRLRRIEGLGMGDVKMMGMVGAFLGVKPVLLTLFLGSLIGSVVGVGAVWLGGRGMQTKLPFGTFLGLAAATALFVGRPLIDWYTGLF